MSQQGDKKRQDGNQVFRRGSKPHLPSTFSIWRLRPVHNRSQNKMNSVQANQYASGSEETLEDSIGPGYALRAVEARIEQGRIEPPQPSEQDLRDSLSRYCREQYAFDSYEHLGDDAGPAYALRLVTQTTAGSGAEPSHLSDPFESDLGKSLSRTHNIEPWQNLGHSVGANYALLRVKKSIKEGQAGSSPLSAYPGSGQRYEVARGESRPTTPAQAHDTSATCSAV